MAVTATAEHATLNKFAWRAKVVFSLALLGFIAGFLAYCKFASNLPVMLNMLFGAIAANLHLTFLTAAQGWVLANQKWAAEGFPVGFWQTFEWPIIAGAAGAGAMVSLFVAFARSANVRGNTANDADDLRAEAGDVKRPWE
jgi:uncharacterized integral membrane protein